MKKDDKVFEHAAGVARIRDADYSLTINKREIEAHYAQMIQEIEDYAIILLDARGTVLNWNKGAEKIKGFTKEEIIGKSFENFYLPEDRKRGLPMKLLQQVRARGKVVTEGWRLKQGGKKFWGSVVITALHNQQGEIIGFSKVTRDLTTRKRAEEKLMEYSKILEFQNSELEEFAYATSHDMKEPLRKIHLYNTFVLDNPENRLDNKSRDFLGRSIDAIRRMTQLIEDLLTYSKATSRLENLSEVDLNDVVKEVTAEVKDGSSAEDIVFHVPDLPVIHAIPFQCKQLMDNLLNNAVKYRRAGQPCVVTFDYQLTRGSEIPDRLIDKKTKYHHITISDNGIGFEPAYNEKVFEVFQRLHHPPESKGSGIGLAICKKIMQNHHGFIAAEGSLTEGARFHLYFPVKPPNYN